MDASTTEAQLELIDEPEPEPARSSRPRPRDWHLDAHEREIGLRGVDRARQALAQARRIAPAHVAGDGYTSTQRHADAA